MKRQVEGLFLACLVILWGGLYFAFQAGNSAGEPLPPPVNHGQASHPNPAPFGTFSEVTVPASVPASSRTPSESSIQLPPLNLLRAETQENPHRPPLSLLDFSEVIATELKKAESDLSVAHALMTQMEECLSGPNAVAIQAFCFQTAAQLGRFHHGQLRARLGSLSRRVPAQTRKLLRLYRSLAS